MRISKQSISNPISLIALVASISFLAFIGYGELSAASDQRTADKITQKVKLAENAEVRNSEYYGAKRAQLAMQEYGLDVSESRKGCDCGPVIDKYTQGNNAQWCTMFASWITKEAGSPVVNESTGKWRINNSRDFVEYLKEHGTWYTQAEIQQRQLEPKLGDFIVYWRGDFDAGLGHVDIVVDPGNNPGYAETVGGNVRDKIVKRTAPYRDNYGFLGFGRPEKL